MSYCAQIMKAHFGMVAPDVEIEDGKGTPMMSLLCHSYYVRRFTVCVEPLGHCCSVY